MQKELLEQIVKKAKDDKKELYIVLSSISSEQGLSTSSTKIEIDPNRVSVILDTICVRILGKVYVDIDKYDRGVNDLYIPYDQILFVGIK